MTDLLRIVGRYHVERLIAHGGMGSVYLARDPAIDRLIVIKVLKEGFDDRAARERFAREARAAGRLHHPNIVTIFDVGEHDDRPFIAMEYVAGETLAQLVGRRAVGPVWERLAILEDLCAGLHYAHCASIVHRDIKPANVMLDGTGLVKILDFGIARGGGGGLTGAGDIVGTLNYMSPEQLAGGPVDHRTDVYSVGAVAYELITGQMAFPGTIQTGVLFNILNSSPVPVESLVPGTDPDITAMIGRAMARHPGDRYEDLDILREDLAAVRTRLLETAPDVAEVADPNAETRFESPRISSDVRSRPSSSRIRSVRRTGAVPMLTPSGRSRLPHRRRTALAVVLAGAVLALALVAILVLDWNPITRPAADAGAASQPQPPAAPAVVPSAAPVEVPDEGVRTERDEQVNDPRLTPRQQVTVGDRQRPTGQKASAAAPPEPKAKSADDAIGSTSPKPGNPPAVTVPSVESLKTVPGAAGKVAGTPLPPPMAPRPEPPPAPREPAPDPRAADLAAIRETLRRYTEAYESLNGGAVGTLMPSLTPRQLRDLERDLASYRRYSVEITGERIVVDGATATVTCQVGRSFETKTGVEGSKTVPSIFHLRRSGAGWIIERLESR